MITYWQKNPGRNLAVIFLAATCLGNLYGCSNPAGDPSTQKPENPAVITSAMPADEAAIDFPEPASTILFNHLGMDSGLSQISINCILQDKRGFMWLGTQDGLNRYDGYNFHIYRPEAGNPGSIGGRWITALAEDAQGMLWVGTRLEGVDRYDPATDRFVHYRHSDGEVNSLSSDHVTTIFADSSGALWIGTDGGLDKYSPTLDGFVHVSLKGTEREEDYEYFITTIHEDEHGAMWVGTYDAGLFQQDSITGRFIEHSSLPDAPTSLSSNSINDIEQAGKNTLWIATDNGLDLFNTVSGVTIHYRHSEQDSFSLSSDAIQTLYLDLEGKLWIGTDKGLNRYQGSTGHFIRYKHDSMVPSSLSDNLVSAIHESRDSVIWVGTFGGGLNTYYRGQDQFRHYFHKASDANSLAGNVLFQIHVDDSQQVWISIHGAGVDRLDTVSGTVTHNQNDPANPGSLSNDNAWAVYTDSHGILWVGTSAGLDRRDPGATDFIHYRHDPADPNSLLEGEVYTILESPFGDLWIGTEQGLERYVHQTGCFTHYLPDPERTTSLSGGMIVSLLIDSRGDLWAGSFNDGLNLFDSATQTFRRFTHDPLEPGSISNDSILAIFEDSRNRLWIGTAGGGLNRYDAGTGTFMHYYETDGLPSDVVNGILEDGSGSLWLSTNNGLSRFNPEENTFRNFTAKDGIQSNEFNMNAFAMDEAGRMYFGGVNGLTVFDPDTLMENSTIPPIALLSITSDGEPVEIQVGETMPRIEIRWPNNSLEFEFAALSYAEPGENQYAYQLEDFEADWNETGTLRVGRYTNLPGGNYTLRLKGSNQDGKWNESGLSIEVVVIPPFWRNAGFLSAAGMLLAGLVYSGYRMRVKTIRDHNRALERQVEERTRKIEHLFEKSKELVIVEERNRLARELHDTAKQKAFAALAQLGTVKTTISSDIQAARSHLVEAENLVYEVIEELTFLIQEMYPLALKEKGLANSLREYAFEWENRNDIRVELTISGERRLDLESEQAIYRVIQESLSNVARHSRATHVAISLTFTGNEVEAVVVDDGCGFNPGKNPAGIGLRSIRERVESLGGVVRLESQPECGTRLVVRIPTESRQSSTTGESNGKP